jgi:hypothetical protein
MLCWPENGNQRLSRLTIGVLLVAWLGGLSAFGQQSAPVTPLRHTHAHNDYEHRRPLFDALDQGFTSVEADVFLVGDRLLVGHTASSLKPERTLERLYLDPLRERARSNGGRIYSDGPPFYLLIDVKTAATPAYRRLHEVLTQYGDLLTSVREGKAMPGAVTAVISGNRDKAAMAAQQLRFAGVDGRVADLDGKDSALLMPWISDRWGALFKWTGDGAIPAAEQARLRDLVKRAHEQGKMVRFWATPEKAALWSELYSAGVDLINTDQLAELAAFLRKQQKTQRD